MQVLPATQLSRSSDDYTIDPRELVDMDVAQEEDKPRPPIVEALGSVAFSYIHKSLAAGAVSRKSILVIIDSRLAERGRVIEVPCRRNPFRSVLQSEPYNRCK